MATVEVSDRVKQQRYQRTARDFERWVAVHPNATIKRKVQAFNSIADNNFLKRRAKRI